MVNCNLVSLFGISLSEFMILRVSDAYFSLMEGFYNTLKYVFNMCFLNRFLAFQILLYVYSSL